MEPFLRDVHAMLRLPIEEIEGLNTGCNFPSTLTLLEVVGGVSQELYLDPEERAGRPRKYKNDTARFKGLLEEYFPWAEEPEDSRKIIGKDAAEVLYRAFRCALAHNLGRVKS